VPERLWRGGLDFRSDLFYYLTEQKRSGLEKERWEGRYGFKRERFAGNVPLDGVGRLFEEKTFELLKLGKLVGFHHPNVGQEAVDVGTCYNLRRDDTIMPTHRGKLKYLMKGVEMKTMWAGMYGRSNGSGRGIGPASHSGIIPSDSWPGRV